MDKTERAITVGVCGTLLTGFISAGLGSLLGAEKYKEGYRKGLNEGSRGVYSAKVIESDFNGDGRPDLAFKLSNAKQQIYLRLDTGELESYDLLFEREVNSVYEKAFKKSAIIKSKEYTPGLLIIAEQKRKLESNVGELFDKEKK